MVLKLNDWNHKNFKVFSTMETQKIWIEISRIFLLHAIDSLKRVRKGQEKKNMFLWMDGAEICFTIDRPTIRYPGAGFCPGTIVISFQYLLSLLKVNPLNTPVRFEFINDKLQMESARWPASFRPDFVPCYVGADKVEFISKKSVTNIDQGPRCPGCGSDDIGDLSKLKINKNLNDIQISLVQSALSNKAQFGCNSCSASWILFN
jgi:hypothetical protein